MPEKKQQPAPQPRHTCKAPGFSASDSPIVKGHWEGLPYEGPAMNIKPGDSPDKKPKLFRKVHCRIFKLDNEQDLADYEQVLNGLAALPLPTVMVLGEDLRYDEKTGKRTTFLKWVEQKYVGPDSKK